MQNDGAQTTLQSRTMPNLFSRWRNDRSGSTAVEFAIVAAPFFMFVFALIGISYYYFVINSVEKGMDQSSRLIRTGQAVTSKMTVDEFKKKICDGAGNWIKCNNLQVFVKHYPDWADLAADAPQPCLDKNQVVIQNTTPGNQLIAIEAGDASDVVIVTACYLWNFTATFPYIKIGNMKNGAMMVQTATAFRSEPYPES